MIYGIGVDIAVSARFQAFLDKHNDKVLERIFTAAEREMCCKRKDAASCLAARFAAKEALLKALGTGLRDGISWHDMEVVHNELGKPELQLSGRAKELYTVRKISNLQLSLSHDGGQAIAMVILESL